MENAKQKQKDYWKEAFIVYQKNTLKQLSTLGKLMSKHGISNNEIINALK